MTTTRQCLLAFLVFYGVTFAQEQQEIDPTNYTFKFKVENVNAQASDAILKDIKTYSKDLFETHPSFSEGQFTVTTAFPVPEDRIRQYLEMYGFNVTDFRVAKGGEILTTQSKEK